MSPWRSEPEGRGPRLETKVAFRYVPGMAHTGRPRLGLRVMTPAERVRRHRAKRARDAAALRLNQIVCGHAQKPGCGRPVLPSATSEALGQVPGGSGLGVNAEDHGVLANGMADGVEKGRTV